MNESQRRRLAECLSLNPQPMTPERFAEKRENLSLLFDGVEPQDSFPLLIEYLALVLSMGVETIPEAIAGAAAVFEDLEGCIKGRWDRCEQIKAMARAVRIQGMEQ